MIMDN